MASEAELAWLAGILEGEGSFMTVASHVGGKTYYYPKITVNMTDEDIIQRVADLLGNSVYAIPQRPNRKQAYRASISGAKAAEWMVALLPWMGVRRSERIQGILEEYGKLEPVNVRRARACSESQRARWAIYGTREGRLVDAESA